MNNKKLLAFARELRKMQRHPYSRENRVLLLTMQSPEEQPREIGGLYGQRYGDVEMNGDRVIQIYRRNDLGKVQERIALCRAAWEMVEGARRTLKTGGQVDWASLVKQLPAHKQRERLVLVAVLAQFEKSLDSELRSVLEELGTRSACSLFESACVMEGADCVDQTADRDTVEMSLRRQLDHARNELSRIRSEVREQVEEAVSEEREQFFMRLNQEEYGQIMDLLAMAQAGFAKLRQQKKQVPMEIRSVQTLVRCLRRFMEDYGVTPMAELGDVLELSAVEMDRYLYEGTPFHGDNQRKRVQVVSPGWEIADKQIVISYPRVQEVEE